MCLFVLYKLGRKDPSHIQITDSKRGGSASFCKSLICKKICDGGKIEQAFYWFFLAYFRKPRWSRTLFRKKMFLGYYAVDCSPKARVVEDGFIRYLFLSQSHLI